ncbi:MAG: hydroxyacid dehydrogenase [Firmicutes bacterium]|nr:hydroxyacid dehydrogenase [Bacillota bacterium]
MKEVKRISAEILKTFPTVDEAVVEAMLQEEVQKNEKKIVVLDDDPTGVQTVHDISVYTGWDLESIREGFAEGGKLFYILTNSRGLTAAQTTQVHEDIARRVAQVSRETGRDFILMSRSDSTLRGHYPLEPRLLKDIVEEETGMTIDGEVMCPFFKEGGRFTIDDVHYVKYGDELVPAGETEFAKDKTFGYTASDIKDYIEEKTGGEYKAADVTSISLEDIRALNIDKIVDQLMQVRDFNKIVVNAIDYVDVKIFCVALYRAMAKGKHFMFRTAAAIVKEIGGISAQPLLTREQMITKETRNGGVIVVGSHTEKTTRQLEELKKIPGIVSIEFDSDLVLDDAKFAEETKRVRKLIEETIAGGTTAVAYTRRKLLVIENDTKEDALVRSVKISDAVQSLVGELTVEPSFVIAKGGITSSDVGTKALRVRRANVMGQIRPGIPVWQTREESKFPNTPYVIFPGNVGEDITLREAAEILMQP